MEVDFFPETQACALCFVTRERMQFSVDGESFSLRQGQRLYFHNAFKFSKEVFVAAVEMAGFELVLTEQEAGNPCVLHVLRSSRCCASHRDIRVT